MGSTRLGLTEEYRENAVSLVIEDSRTIAEVARSIGIKPQTLGRWVQKARQNQPAETELSKTEREELERLRQENQRLRLELEFAKKAAAWFAKDPR
ncbi:MAG: transposase [Propionibacteriaceae bacterium]|jgi:transposase|nr:transposase [Propionibacteriaceae bacterium]